MQLEVALAVDTSSVALKTFQINLPVVRTRQESVESLFDGTLGTEPTQREADLRAQTGRVDILLGGPPCQGVSSLNNRTRMNDPRNALYLRMARAAEVLQPEFVLIENVPGANRDSASVVARTVSALHDAGYATHADVVEMTKLGVPQKRKRLVLLAVRSGADPATVLRRAVDMGSCKHIRSVRWAIEDIAMSRATVLDTPTALSKRSLKRIEYLHKQDRYDLPNALRPRCHGGDHSYVSMYGRLRWDEPAQTITSGFGSMGQGRFVHPNELRTLTPHEAARLQTLPDYVRFPDGVGRTTLAELIANAVPPLANVAIMRSLLEGDISRLSSAKSPLYAA